MAIVAAFAGASSLAGSVVSYFMRRHSSLFEQLNVLEVIHIDRFYSSGVIRMYCRLSTMGQQGGVSKTAIKASMIQP